MQLKRPLKCIKIALNRLYANCFAYGMMIYQDFKELKDTYVIFICQHDKFKENKPIYHVDKIIRETGKVFDDGAHIIYVNGKYRGEDDYGKLAHDFNCKKADNIYFKPLADGVRHFKETEKERDAMCESFEKSVHGFIYYDSETYKEAFKSRYGRQYWN